MKTTVDDTILDSIEDVKDKFKKRYGKSISSEQVLDIIDIQHKVATIGIIKGFHIHFNKAFKLTNFSIVDIRNWYNENKKRLTNNAIFSDVPLDIELEELRLQRNRIIASNEKNVQDTRTKPSITLKELKDAPILRNYNKRNIKIDEEYLNYKKTNYE